MNRLVISEKEVRNKILSIKNTKKITKAMEMVAASKMKKAQKKVLCSLPYAHAIKKIINRITTINSEYKHQYFESRPVKRVGYFILSSDRGLCGSLNINLFKKVLLEMKSWMQKKVEIDLAIIGFKAFSFFSKIKCNIVANINNLGNNPEISVLNNIIKIMLKAYDSKHIDKLFIVHNQFINTMFQIPKVNLILPLMNTQKEDTTKTLDYIYEPDAKFLLNILLIRYIEFQVYQSFIENLASEQSARMMAMKTATDNAENLIQELKLNYNKIRQANITKELIEIISGASVI